MPDLTVSSNVDTLMQSSTYQNFLATLRGSVTALPNGNATLGNGINILATALSASRTYTLPLASSVPTGHELIIIIDQSASVSSSRTITINRAGSDTVNGLTSLIINKSSLIIRLVSTASASWTYEAGSLGLPSLAETLAFAIVL